MSEFFESIKDFFSDLFTPGPQTMGYWTLYKKISKWSIDKFPPTAYEFTDLIELPDSFWSEVINIYRNTKSDGLERAISVFWGDGELLVTSLTTGNENSVTPKGKVYIQYVPTSRPEYFRKEIYLNDKLFSKEDIYYKKMPEKIIVQHLFNMHSHPPHDKELWSNNDQTKIQKESYGNIYVGNHNYYSFFSKQDMIALFSSNNYVTGLVTDRLWLVFRTSQSIDITSRITDVDMSLKTMIEDMKLIVYQGEFRKRLSRINIGPHD